MGDCVSSVGMLALTIHPFDDCGDPVIRTAKITVGEEQ